MASSRRKTNRNSPPKEVSLDEMLERGGREQRPTTDTEPSLRDGNSSKGDRYWDAEDEITTDNDVGDTMDTGEPLAGPSGGAVGGTPARGRAVDHVRRGLSWILGVLSGNGVAPEDFVLKAPEGRSTRTHVAAEPRRSSGRASAASSARSAKSKSTKGRPGPKAAGGKKR